VLREIRGIEQRHPGRTRRWFQDEYFDLFVWEDRAGAIERFQLAYARDTRRERVLEWRRRRGFQHLKLEALDESKPGRDAAWALKLDGVLPYAPLMERFAAAARGLPRRIGRFVEERITEHARPARKLRRRGARVPPWLERLRRRQAQDPRGEE